jgi:hypothetical protein
MFGVPLDQDFDRSTEKEKTENRAFVKELIDILISIDPDQNLMDFEKPSSFI